MERWEKQEVHKSYGTFILRIFFILPTFYVVFRLLHACNMTSILYLMLLSTLSTVLVYSQSDCIFTVSDSGRNISYDLGSLRHSTHTVNDKRLRTLTATELLEINNEQFSLLHFLHLMMETTTHCKTSFVHRPRYTNQHFNALGQAIHVFL